MKTNLRRVTARLAMAGVLILSAQYISAQPKDAKTKKAGKTAPSAAVDLNTASQADLEKVPGIGTATAKKIISNRPYSSVPDLSKAGLSAKQIQSISPMVMVGAATAAPKTARATPPPAPTASPAPTPAPTKGATGSTPASAQQSYKPAVPPPGPGMVWVNTSTKVFHRAGSKWYGNTKAGKYMSESDAVKAGYHESKEN